MTKAGWLAVTCCLVLLSSALWADTGTYRIAQYDVRLTPRSDGTVEIEYHQKWSVTGGHIPWITVGTANSNFQILGDRSAGAVRSIRSDNSGNWSGVRIALDKDYGPGESFEVRFAIVQRQLFHADQTNYRLEFTPGWYDRAATEGLRVEVVFFANLRDVTARPTPTRIQGQSLIWEAGRLAPGGRFQVSAFFPKKAFPRPIATGQLDSSSSAPPAIALGVLAVMIFLLVLAFVGVTRARRRYGAGGGIYYGGVGGRSGGPGGGGVRTGGGGGFGGRSSSCVCACACVGCACACACAGGGGAGCDRKLRHRCPLCNNCPNRQSCPVVRGAAA